MTQEEIDRLVKFFELLIKIDRKQDTNSEHTDEYISRH